MKGILPVFIHNVSLFITDLKKTIAEQNFTLRDCIGSFPQTRHSQSILLQNYWVVEKTFAISKSKLPINGNVFPKVLANIQFMLSAECDKLMYNALFLLAYHVCLRVSELAHYQNIDDVLQYHQLFCVMEHSSPRCLSIAFLRRRGKPVTLFTNMDQLQSQYG